MILATCNSESSLEDSGELEEGGERCRGGEREGEGRREEGRYEDGEQQTAHPSCVPDHASD